MDLYHLGYFAIIFPASSNITDIVISDSRANPDSKVHGANMRPIWGRQDPVGPYVGPMIFAIWEDKQVLTLYRYINHLYVIY